MSEASSESRIGRLIQDGVRNGAFNMAADLSFAEYAVETSHLILRFYTWDKPTLSIGYHQKLSRRQIERCLDHGVLIVRRPTGGRAVLHDRELTYCLCISEKHPVYSRESSSMLKSIGSAFVSAAVDLGLNAQLVRTGNRDGSTIRSLRKGSPLCFESASLWEVRLEGRKWIGSAQRFLPGMLLQHGSILLQRSTFDIDDLLGLQPRTANDKSMAFAQECEDISEAGLREAIAREFGQRWDLKWNEQPLRPEEVDRIIDLAKDVEYYRETIDLTLFRSVSTKVA